MVILTLSSSSPCRRPRQDGAVIVLVCFLLLFLLGFMAIAFDFGRLFVVKTELQTAMDSCALAAAQELDLQTSAIIRARSAGRTAANVNRVNLQSTNWDAKGQLVDSDISFRDAAYAPTTLATAARYAECSHTQTGVRMWLMHATGAFNGDTNGNPADRAVLASAVATRASAQSACPIPVALVAKAGTAGPDYGFSVGDWVVVKSLQSTSLQPGEMGWFNLDGTGGGRETKDEMSEGALCGTKYNDTGELSTKGDKQAVATQWNYRFGLYKGNDAPNVNHPDISGYEYNATNWSAGKNAWPDFLVKRATNVPHAGKLSPYNTVATSADLAQYGFNRRLVTVPVLQSPTATRLVDFACMFMLDPMGKPTDDVHLEFRGNASDPNSPCTSSGLAGGTAGPRVPVLVR